MSVNGGENPTRGKGNKRGSVKNASRLQSLTGRVDGKSQGSADWGNADERWVCAVITAVTLRGGAVSFGLSRDQGAHSLTILLDGERETLWFNQDAELDVELEKVFTWAETLA